MHISGKGSIILGLAPIRILSSQMCGGWFDYFWTLASVNFTMFSTGSVWGGIGSDFMRASSETWGSCMLTGRFEAFAVYFDWNDCVKEVNQFIFLSELLVFKRKSLSYGLFSTGILNRDLRGQKPNWKGVQGARSFAAIWDFFESFCQGPNNQLWFLPFCIHSFTCVCQLQESLTRFS